MIGAGTAAKNRVTPYALLGATVAILGSNWPLLAIGLRTVSPLWLGTMRLLGGTAFVFALAAATGRLKLPPREDIPVVASVAYGRLTIVMVLVFIALRLVPPGRSSVLVWTASLWSVPMAATFLDEHMTTRRWIGITIGIAGVIFLMEPWQADISSSLLAGYALLILAAIFHAATSVHVRHHHWRATPLELLPWQVAAAALPLTAVTLAIEGLPRFGWTAPLVAIVAYQAVLATGVATWAQLTALQQLPAVPTNLTLMLVPVVGLLASALFVDDHLTVGSVTGTAFIVVGVLTGVGLDVVRRTDAAVD